MALHTSTSLTLFGRVNVGVFHSMRTSMSLAEKCLSSKNKGARVKPVPLRKNILKQGLTSILNSSYFALLYRHHGIKAEEMKDLRIALKEEGISLKVIKKYIFMKGMENTDYININNLVHGPCAIVYSTSPNLKGLLAKTKSYGNRFALVGGKVDNMLLTPSQVIAFSKLPSLENQRLELLSILRSPLTELVSSLNHNQIQTLHLLDSYVNDNDSSKSQ